jgi:hypothetical protein
MYVCICMCVYVCAYVCMCVYVCMYVCAVAQAVSRRPLTAEAWFRSRVMRFVVDKVALGQVWFSPVNFIPPVLHYSEKRKN